MNESRLLSEHIDVAWRAYVECNGSCHSFTPRFPSIREAAKSADLFLVAFEGEPTAKVFLEKIVKMPYLPEPPEGDEVNSL